MGEYTIVYHAREPPWYTKSTDHRAAAVQLPVLVLHGLRGVEERFLVDELADDHQERRRLARGRRGGRGPVRSFAVSCESLSVGNAAV